MTRINQIWEELEVDVTGTHGFLFRRYSSAVVPDVFVALKMPEKTKCIATSIPRETTVDVSDFANLRDVQAEVIYDPRSSDRNLLLFKLLNNSHSTVFSVLCEDLMLNIGNPSTPRQLVDVLLDRFNLWKTLFDRINGPGLNNQEQQGLFAELFLLRKMLNAQLAEPSRLVDSWVGPGRQIKDFQTNNMALEVKCTIGNNHQRIHISNERQLDRSNLDKLFLYHLSAESRQNGGETLPNLINRIDGIIGNLITYTRFRSKLIEAGYFETHVALYDDVGYTVRSENFYEVYGDFPRIEERDLKPGVGDVKYSIILSHCTQFKLEESMVFSQLTFL